MLLAARTRTLSLCADLEGERLLGPRLSIVNPPLWEIGHVGWFQEHWCLRYRTDGRLAPSVLSNADDLYNSAAVPHDTRWDLPLPDFDATLAYLRRVLDGVLERIELEGATEHMAYFAQLAAFHEEMHCEAFTYTRQTLGYPAPRTSDAPTSAQAGAWPGDVEISGGVFRLGATQTDGFVFDNEKWAHEVEVGAFRMARAPVSNAEFAAFVEDHGYRRRELWSTAGWEWRKRTGAQAPVYWIGKDGAWFYRHYDEVIPVAPRMPVIHLNWFEAEAYCRWAGRRLPTEAEWEFAAATMPGSFGAKRRYPWGDAAPSPALANLYGATGGCVDVAAFPLGDSGWGCRQMFGNVWEWTADWFEPYPGFVRDPYKEYSEPWFGDHKVLRGGCHATRPVLLRNTWRNFYTPDRRDVFAGFRTCAPFDGNARALSRHVSAREPSAP
ncbi:MAG: ergothioneine biosynthesis protein EgtB [Betaproteobacteria bacterium]|nr:ergothioneine biosynthesis protein EgtB [Betaproteobacteria bacterium]